MHITVNLFRLPQCGQIQDVHGIIKINLFTKADTSIEIESFYFKFWNLWMFAWLAFKILRYGISIVFWKRKGHQIFPWCPKSVQELAFWYFYIQILNQSPIMIIFLSMPEVHNLCALRCVVKRGEWSFSRISSEDELSSLSAYVILLWEVIRATTSALMSEN